ncbi:MAG TPA: rod shape-determining protein RodA [Polyangiaceae bacterium]|jgi:rod shape determining protein RodA|nr:rod shape-determining protein RodA [Polyangiaceae bacterium]
MAHARRGLRVREQFDWPLLLSIFAVAIVGLVNLYSATSPYLEMGGKTSIADIYVTQVYWLVVGGLMAILVTLIDYRNFERLAYVAYGVGLFSLALVFFVASDVRGAARWIRLGSFAFQPSEFMKLGVILAVARFLSEDPKTEARSLVDLIPAAALLAVPSGLVMAQPDFGTSIILVLTVGCMLAMARIRVRSILTLVATVAGSAPILWQYVLRDYQKDRILSFINPEADLTGAGWHAFQSQTAIGNGGVWGSGFREGTQNQFGFLPDQFSDFPFAVFAEDWGFLGSFLLVCVYSFICIWAIRIASMAKDRFGAAVAIGVGAMIFWHTVFNLGMATGVLPVVGITLPLFSYGGSSVLTIMIGFGLLMNVSLRR